MTDTRRELKKCDVRSSRVTGFDGRTARRGFTLIEVIVAMAILAIVSVSFASFSMASSQRSSQDLIRVKAQNLADVTMEDLTGQSVSAIKGLIAGIVITINYPVNGFGGAAAVLNGYHVIVPGQFLMTGLTNFFGVTGVGSVSGVGTISALETSPYNTYVQREGPGPNDYYPAYATQLTTMSQSAFTVQKYKVAGSVVIEPMLHGDGTWDAGLIVFQSQFPHFEKEITIVNQTPTIADDAAAYLTIDVKIIWTFSGHHQMIEVSGEKIGIY